MNIEISLCQKFESKNYARKIAVIAATFCINVYTKGKIFSVCSVLDKWISCKVYFAKRKCSIGRDMYCKIFMQKCWIQMTLQLQKNLILDKKIDKVILKNEKHFCIL